MKHITWMALLAALLCVLLAVPALAENQYYAVREPIEISAAQNVTLTLDAQADVEHRRQHRRDRVVCLRGWHARFCG